MAPSGLRAVRLVVPLLCLAAPVRAQLIPIKTIPIAQGDQFQIFPANNLGMGSVSIALADSLNDPFVNPAMGTRLAGARFFSSPTVYSVSRNAGGGRSLPFAALARSREWYGGLALALQQVDPSRPPGPDQFFGVATPNDVRPLVADPRIPQPDTRAHGNEYAFAMVGRDLSGSNISIGASALWTGLHALDGVDLLYAGSRRVVQRGHTLDLRVGAVKAWPGQWGARSLEALILHNDFAATHTVTYVDNFWDPGTELLLQRARIEQNLDRTHTWGMHLKYAFPFNAAGWRIGWIATVNQSSHPKIPNYELANVPAIPRDPGHSTAFDFGIGLSKVRGAATFGVDFVYEPIRSYTWADAVAPMSTASGDTLAAGAKTVENHFHFSNTQLRIGAGRDIELKGLGKAVGLQLGLILRSVRYSLEQQDNVQALQRQLTTGWMEWTPTWGLSLRFPEFEIRYRGSVTHGAGRPQSEFTPAPWGLRDVALAGGTILAAPSGPLNLTDVSTTTHQISLSLPLR
ncbi:MAG: hypothetical protein DMD58_14110 [Gemmatimonadetes bacterium]|nr:MAG: hypothetical protein DMD58_14110 [Gemmatimonadota bacterium]